MFPKTSNL